MSSPVRKQKKQEKAKWREKITEQDTVEAICLIREEHFSIAAASSFTNKVKTNKSCA
jgi:hypothetical protein